MLQYFTNFFLSQYLLHRLIRCFTYYYGFCFCFLWCGCEREKERVCVWRFRDVLHYTILSWYVVYSIYFAFFPSIFFLNISLFFKECFYYSYYAYVFQSFCVLVRGFTDFFYGQLMDLSASRSLDLLPGRLT